VAALDEGCNYVAIEKDELYQKLAEKRLHVKRDVVLSERSQNVVTSGFMDSITEVE
jgi:hypothetical protein